MVVALFESLAGVAVTVLVAAVPPVTYTQEQNGKAAWQPTQEPGSSIHATAPILTMDGHGRELHHGGYEPEIRVQLKH